MFAKIKGFTLVEVIVVCLILTVVLVGFLGVFNLSLSLNETSINSVIAVNDACSVLERIKNIDPFDSAVLVAAYPDGGFVAGYNNLPQETVQVNYANLAADPIHVSVTVNWQEKSRLLSESVVTLVTQR